MILHLGVVDKPHLKGATTGSVANYLEERYGVMQMFYDRYADQINNDITQRLLDALESNLSNPFDAPIDDITKTFHSYLETREVEQDNNKLPSQRAIDGYKSRMKNPTHMKKGKKLVKRPRRESLIDTGVYMNSFVAWVDI